MSQKFSTLWEHFFKPEARSAGASFSAKAAVRLIQPSDTEVQAHVQGAAGIKVLFKTDSVESPLVRASCSCPNGKKSQFCKHMWATLLQIENAKPDFLEGKNDIQAGAPVGGTTAASESQAKHKARQEDFRKAQYERQKQRAKEMRADKKSTGRFSGPQISIELAAALAYFSENGFSLDLPLDIAQLNHAKKILSRVFHPDKGGTHQEILELNKNCDIVTAHLANHG